ncbi:short-chain dehydrogenase/reductase family 16C member 6 [Galendromus occidentalis]|uniref:Short-chain dehydrogenase/reductase family 16C member 6 n=1 Tax=Galendromus occidentalis TaxID=34638 RepID=A0AAJ6QRZ7_9ACAR|nr:short-chain dehydrogenase/reductase family 16C member 6 [Galendromus occidentalis]
MGYVLVLFNWIIYIVEMSRLISRGIRAIFNHFFGVFRPPPPKDVKDRVVVVAGAASGLGSEISHRFARLGAQVIMLDIDEHANLQAANELRRMGNNKVFSFPCDVSVESQVNAVAAKILKFFGKVDILVNNATRCEPHSASPLIQSPSESIQKTLFVNLLSHFWMTRAFLPSMIEKKSGHIVAISSLSGLMGTSKYSSFCASQHGVMGAMSAMASELEDYPGIYVSTACPVVEGPSVVESALPPAVRKFLDLELPSQRETASLIVDAVLRNREFVIIPRGFTILRWIDQLLPQKLSKFAQEAFMKENSGTPTPLFQGSTLRMTNGNSCH